MNTRPLYQRIASSIEALSNCITSGNKNWQARHEDNANTLTRDFMPSGSGIDCGTKLDVDASLRQMGKLVFTLSFHHMNENGMYDGWTEHKAIVSPSLTSDFDLKVTGRDRNGIKEYLAETLDFALRREIAQDDNGEYFAPDIREAQKAFAAKVASGEIV